MMYQPVAMRPLTEDDLPFAESLCDHAGWNQVRGDWRRLMAHDPGGCFVAAGDDGQHANLDAEWSAMPTRECLREYAGPAVIETFTVLPDPAGAPHALLAACLTPAGERSWATCADSALLASIEREELCGRAATIATDGSMEVSG